MLRHTPGLGSLSRIGVIVVALALAGTTASKAQAQAVYTDPPPLLSEAASAVAQSIVFAADDPNAKPEQALDKNYAMLVFYTVADAVTPADAAISIRRLSARRYVQEIKRTDKQVGAPPSASGSTSLLEKPGLMSLLGFAVEHGGVLRESNGTSATLSATPYSLFTLASEDTAAQYDRYDLLRRVEVSSSIALDQGGKNQDLDFKKIEQFSVRVRVYGDRSTRSQSFTDKWDETVAPLWRRIIAHEHAAARPVYELPAINERAAPLRVELMHLISASLNDTVGDASDVRAERIRAIILNNLYQRVYAPFASNPSLLTAAERQFISEKLVGDLRFDDTLDQITKETKKLLDDTAKSPLVTVGYTNHRVDKGSDYSDAKLMVDATIPVSGIPAPDLLLNAIASFNHHPEHTDTLKQHTIRSYSVSGSLQWAFDDVVLHRIIGGPTVKDKIVVAVSGRYERTEDQDDNIWLAQGRIELPLTTGVTLPVSVTYASRSELVDEKEVRGNFGISVDTDKLAALARLVQASPQARAALQATD